MHFLFRHEFEVVFAWIVKKSDFVDSEIVVWGLTSLTDFYKRVHLLFRKRRVRLSKENLFWSNNAPEIHIFNSLLHRKLLLVAKQLQDSTFYIKSEDIGISKLVSQVMWLPRLFTLKDNDTIVMSTIVKNSQRCDEIDAS